MPRTPAKAPTPEPDAARARELFARGLALHGEGKLAEAQTCFTDVLRLQPEHAEALHALGVIAAQSGNPARAVELLDQALAIRPDYAMACYNRGNALKDAGQIDAAIASYDRAIAIKPDFAKALSSRSILWQWKKQSAKSTLVDAVDDGATQQQSAQACYRRGLKLQEQKRFDEAVVSFDQALAMQADFAEAFCGRGIALKGLAQLDAAIASYDRAIALNPGFAQAYYNRAIALQDKGQDDAALASYDRAIEARPDYARAYAARANALLKTGRADAAVADCDRALAIDPEFADGHAFRGAALVALKRIDETLVSYNRAIALKPDYIEAHWNRSLALLLSGDFNNGWREYEWRWKNENLRLVSRWKDLAPLWLGEPSLKGKTILLHAEQGLGDTLQFCRYVQPLKAQGAKVILEVQPVLHSLLKNLDGASVVITKNTPPPAFDVQCPLLSLPLALRTTLDTVPHPERYIHSDKGLVSEWRARLGRKRKPRIGLVWSGSPKHKGDQQRSIFLNDLLTLLSPDFEFFSLQKELRDADADVLHAHPAIRHFGADLGDFSDTAALCELMDLVISVDTSVAHLAGAMGRPLWVLLPFIPDWRWLLDREDSPWYSSARLFRQPQPGDWAAVLNRVRAELMAGSFLKSVSRKPAPST